MERRRDLPREDSRSLRPRTANAKPPVAGFQNFAAGDNDPLPRERIAETLADACAGKHRTSGGTLKPSLFRTYRCRMVQATQR